jgi:hypothetical protein
MPMISIVLWLQLELHSLARHLFATYCIIHNRTRTEAGEKRYSLNADNVNYVETSKLNVTISGMYC